LCHENETLKRINKRKDDLNNFTDYINNLVEQIPVKTSNKNNDPTYQNEYDKINSHLLSVNEKLNSNAEAKSYLRNNMNKMNQMNTNQMNSVNHMDK